MIKDEQELSSALARRISSARHRAKVRGIDPEDYEFYRYINWGALKGALWQETLQRKSAPQRIEVTETDFPGHIKIEALFATGLPWIQLGRSSKNH